MRLNIIGNGFDLYHGMPSSYYYFGCYMLAHHEKFFTELANMYGFSCGILKGYEDFEYGIDDMFWSRFEEKLGNLDPCWIEESLEDDLGLECSDPVDIEIPEIDNGEIIKTYFKEWVRVTLDIKKNYQIVKRNLREKKLHFDNNDYFINYCYTHTLENIYRISQNKIFYIHGENDEDSEIIVGHGNTRTIGKYEEEIEEMENSYQYYGTQAYRNRCNEYRCKLHVLKSLQKNVSYLIDSMIFRLLSWHEEVEEIYVWGFSCGSVDMPYIERLNKLYPDAVWWFSYFDLNEKRTREEMIAKVGIRKANFFEFNNSKSKRIEKLIVDENNLETFLKIS